MPSTTLTFAEFQHIGHFDPAANHFVHDIEVAAAAHIQHKTGLVHCQMTVVQVQVNANAGLSVFRFTANPDFVANNLKAWLRAH